MRRLYLSALVCLLLLSLSTSVIDSHAQDDSNEPPYAGDPPLLNAETLLNLRVETIFERGRQGPFYWTDDGRYLYSANGYGVLRYDAQNWSDKPAYADVDARGGNYGPYPLAGTSLLLVRDYQSTTTLSLRNVVTGEDAATIPCPTGAIALSNDGTLAAFYHYETLDSALPGGVSLWDIAAGEIVQNLPEIQASGSVQMIAPDNQGVLIWSGQVQELWYVDMATGEETLVVQVPDVEGQYPTLYKDQLHNRIMIYFGGKLSVWDLTTLPENTDPIGEYEILRQPNFYSVAANPNNPDEIAYGVDNASLTLLNLTTAETTEILVGGMPAFNNTDFDFIAFQPGGTLIALATAENSLIIYDRATDEIVLDTYFSGLRNYDAIFTPDDEILIAEAVIAPNGLLQAANIWNYSTGELQTTIDLQSYANTPVDALDFHLSPAADTLTFITRGPDGVVDPTDTVYLMDMDAGTPIEVFQGTAVQYTADGKLLLLQQGNDGTLVYDIATRERRQFTVNFNGATLTPDGRYIVGTTNNGEVHLFEIALNVTADILFAGTSPLYGVQIDDSGRWIVATDNPSTFSTENNQREGTLYIWDRQSPDTPPQRFSMSGGLFDVVVAPADDLLIAMTGTRSIWINPQTGEVIGGRTYNYSMAINSTGTLLLEPGLYGVYTTRSLYPQEPDSVDCWGMG